jgi:phosphate transport system protein
MAPVRGKLQRELDRITDRVTHMGEMVDRAIRRAVQSLSDQDVELARQVIAEDEAINELRFDIEDECYTLLATQQPAASDLRLVVAALHTITELERIADYAKGIGQLLVREGGERLLLPAENTLRMAEFVGEMMRAALEAFAQGDTAKAERVFAIDDDIDHMYREVYESIIQAMITQCHGVRKGMHLLFAAHNLERMGDRVTNISERVIFMATGVMEEQNL